MIYRINIHIYIIFNIYIYIYIYIYGFPGGSDGKKSACNAGDPGSTPGSVRSSVRYPLILAWRIPWTEEPWQSTFNDVAKSQTQLSN